jgi:LacI family transcriptional regulator
VQTLLDARVSGILASQSKTTKEYDHFQEIVDNNVQLVFFDRICTGINTDKVVVDDYEGALKAVDYLASTGCKRIAFLGSDSDLPISNNRRMGYESALRKHKIKVIKSLIKECDTRELAQKIIPDMLNESNTPDAFFCINDEVAAYCLQAVKAVGFRVPEDISICGFTNGYLTEVTEPTLTSVDQHGFEMGITAARLLIDRIEGKETKKGVVSKLIKTELVLRNSTR